MVKKSPYKIQVCLKINLDFLPTLRYCVIDQKIMGERNMKPIIRFNSKGQSGNIYAIFGALYNLFDKNKAGQIVREVISTSKNYDNSLEIISKYVILIDDPTAI